MPATACACDVLHITGTLLPISHRAFDISMRSGGCFFFLFAPGEYCVSYPQKMSTAFLTHAEQVLVSFISVSFKRALGVPSTCAQGVVIWRDVLFSQPQSSAPPSALCGTSRERQRKEYGHKIGTEAAYISPIQVTFFWFLFSLCHCICIPLSLLLQKL
jgi:hypothetical protein